MSLWQLSKLVVSSLDIFHSFFSLCILILFAHRRLQAHLFVVKIIEEARVLDIVLPNLPKSAVLDLPCLVSMLMLLTLLLMKNITGGRPKRPLLCKVSLMLPVYYRNLLKF